ncbi:MAG: CAP domain-containing protein [Chloroflexi bacterium]|nr:CAP domain-containing protein [Chloroflexota bacterium]MCY4248652.1 CAP domain-containing protein [Chloroflexota bacterium]
MWRWILLLIACFALWRLPAQAQSLLSLVNNFRAARGLPGLSLDARLTAAAQNQASWMAANSQCCDHSQGGASTARSRANRFGYSAPLITEIIYLGGSSGDAFAWWQTSAIHTRELMRPSGGQAGIASVSGNNQTAHVVVFGWTGGSGSASGGAAQQPAYVVGLDEFGHIKHEVQPGDDLGTIAWRYYGYNWDILPTIRALNNRTQSEDRLLAPGDILLIPPKAGTYTPVPGTPSAQPQPSATPTDQSATAERPAPSASPAARAATPVPTAPSLRTIRIGNLPRPIATPQPPPIAPEAAATLLELNLLAAAIVTQLLVIGFALAAFIRR